MFILLQSKVKWAEMFYQRALKADPKYALAELGLARLAKLVKDLQALSGAFAEGAGARSRRIRRSSKKQKTVK